jgi:hypothetical protein
MASNPGAGQIAYLHRKSDGNAVAAHVDGMTNALQTIDYSHHEIHASSHYYFFDAATIGSAETKDYLLVVPNTTAWPHITWVFDASTITKFDVYEATTMTGTTACCTQMFNNNRNSTGTAGMRIYTDASGTLDGTLIWEWSSGATSQQSRSPSASRNDEELILKQNTKYLVRFTSYAAANLANIHLTWYEHTNAV